MRTLSVRLDDQTDALLRTFCARTGMNQTDAIKSGTVSLTRQTAEAASPAQLAESLGLIGCFASEKGNTRDLGRHHAQRLREKLARSHRGDYTKRRHFLHFAMLSTTACAWPGLGLATVTDVWHCDAKGLYSGQNLAVDEAINLEPRNRS